MHKFNTLKEAIQYIDHCPACNAKLPFLNDHISTQCNVKCSIETNTVTAKSELGFRFECTSCYQYYFDVQFAINNLNIENVLITQEVLDFRYSGLGLKITAIVNDYQNVKTRITLQQNFLNHYIKEYPLMSENLFEPQKILDRLAKLEMFES